MRMLSKRAEKRLNQLCKLSNSVGGNGFSLVEEALKTLNRCIPGRTPTIEEVVHYILDTENRTENLKGVRQFDEQRLQYARVHYTH